MTVFIEALVGFLMTLVFWPSPSECAGTLVVSENKTVHPAFSFGPVFKIGGRPPSKHEVHLFAFAKIAKLYAIPVYFFSQH